MIAFMGVLDPFRFVLISIASWMNQQQQQAIEYLREENKVLREQLGARRLWFTGRTALSTCGQGKGTRPARSGTGGNNRHSGDSPGLAWEADPSAAVTEQWLRPLGNTGRGSI